MFTIAHKLVHIITVLAIVVAGLIATVPAAPAAAMSPEEPLPAWAIQLQAKDHTVRAGGVRFFQEATLKNATGRIRYVYAQLTLEWAGFGIIGNEVRLTTNLAKSNPNRNLWVYRSSYNSFIVYGELRPGEVATLAVELYSGYNHGVYDRFAAWQLLMPLKKSGMIDYGKLTLTTGSNLPIRMAMTAPSQWLEGEYGELTLAISVPAPATYFSFQVSTTCASNYVFWNTADLTSAYGTVVNHNIEGYLSNGVPCDEMVVSVVGKSADGRVLPPASKRVMILHR